jgi:hypothetical protein
MATAVQIELMVDEKGALQGIRSFDTSVKGTTASVGQLNRQMEAAGAKATSTGRQTKAALENTGVSALSSVEKTRLLTEEFGIRLPRAMVRLAAENKAVQASIGAISGALIGFGAIQIGTMVFTQLIDGAEKLYRKWFDVNGAIKRYNDEAGEAASKKFGEDSGLDQLNADLLKANQQLDELARKKEIATNKNVSWGQFGTILGASLKSIATGSSYDYHFSVADANAQNNAQGSVDAGHLKKLEEDHKKNIQRIEDAALISESKVTGIKKDRLARDAEDAKADEDRRFAKAKAQALAEVANRGIDNKRWNGNLKPGDEGYREAVVVSPDTGNAENADAKAHATAEFKAQQYETDREHTQELAQLREQALEAQLRGVDLYRAQEAFAIAELKTKDMDSVAARAAIHLKFHNEETKRLEDQARQIEEMRGQAALVGFKGVGRIQAQGDLEIAKINANPDLTRENKDLEIEAIKRRVNGEMLDQEREFTLQIDALADERVAHSLKGFAAIQAQADKTIAAAQRVFDTQTAQIDRSTPEGEQSFQNNLQQFNRQKGLIRLGADQDTGDLAHRNSDETLQIEMEARSHLLSAEKNQTAAISAEYEARTAKYYEELQNREIGEDDYNRRVVAAGEQRDAQLIEAAKQAREKMAGEFSRFFSNPMQALKEFGDKAAGEAAATLVQRMQGRIGSGSSTGEHLGMPGSEWSNTVFGRIGGIFHKPNDRSIESAGRNTATGAMTIGAAQIRIGSASIIGMGVANAGFTPGSTSLFSGGVRMSNALYSPAQGMGSAEGFGVSAGSTTGTGGFIGGGTTAASASPAGGINQALGDVDQGMGLIKNVKGLFGSKKSVGGSNDLETQSLDLSGSFDKNGKFSLGDKDGGMLGGGGIKSNALGAASGAMGMFSAIEGNGGVGGALSGAMSGMQLGMAVGGPLGAAVGAAAGAIVGAIGFGGKEKARVYDLKTVQPRITADILGFSQGTMDYTSAYSDLESLDGESRKALRAMGGFGDRYYWDHVNGEIRQAEGKLTAEERAGRSHFTATAAQQHQGGWSGDFGDMATGPDTGWAHMKANEFTVHEQAAATHAGALEAIRAGASHADMARYYGADPGSIARGYRTAMAGSGTRQWGGGDRTVNMNFHSLDSKSVARMFNENKHHLRAALNASYAENSGGADA